MLPSVRGRRRLLTSFVLLSALIIGALSFSLLARLAFSWVHVRSAWLPAAIVFAGVALDLSPWPPIDVGTQVPQAWGHRHGPLAAAARYGLRLGIAPGTILTTWLWWSGTIVASITSWRAAIISALSFAVVRFFSMVAVAFRAGDGVAMARRMSRWRSSEPLVCRAGLAVSTAIACLALAA